MYWIWITPALRNWSACPEIAIAPKEVPLKSKCADSDRQGPPGHESVITTLTGFPEHALFPVHFTWF